MGVGKTKDNSKIRNKAIAKKVLINCIKKFEETMGTSYEQGEWLNAGRAEGVEWLASELGLMSVGEMKGIERRINEEYAEKRKKGH